MQLEKYKRDTFTAKITAVTETTPADFVRPEALPKWNEPDRVGLRVIAESEGQTIERFLTIPKVTGYQKSNLKKFLERNDLPYDTDKWVGLEAEAIVDAGGFLRLAL